MAGGAERRDRRGSGGGGRRGPAEGRLRSGHPAGSQPLALGAAGRAWAAAREGCAPSVPTERLDNSGKCPSYLPSHLSFPMLNGCRVYVGKDIKFWPHLSWRRGRKTSQGLAMVKSILANSHRDSFSGGK